MLLHQDLLTHPVRKISLQRFALPEDVADLCLCVINNGYINGAELVIDADTTINKL